MLHRCSIFVFVFTSRRFVVSLRKSSEVSRSPSKQVGRTKRRLRTRIHGHVDDESVVDDVSLRCVVNLGELDELCETPVNLLIAEHVRRILDDVLICVSLILQCERDERAAGPAFWLQLGIGSCEVYGEEVASITLGGNEELPVFV